MGTWMMSKHTSRGSLGEVDSQSSLRMQVWFPCGGVAYLIWDTPRQKALPRREKWTRPVVWHRGGRTRLGSDFLTLGVGSTLHKVAVPGRRGHFRIRRRTVNGTAKFTLWGLDIRLSTSPSGLTSCSRLRGLIDRCQRGQYGQA